MQASLQDVERNLMGAHREGAATGNRVTMGRLARQGVQKDASWAIKR
jgi:hypothetical protein